MSSGLKSSQQEGNSMIAYQSTLLGRTEVAEDTMAFRFEKPRSFVFKAGQYIDLTLLGSEPGGSNGLTHTFSIASSPWAEELVVTTRMRDTVFKRALSVLPIGAEVRVEGPMGSFTLHNNTARPAVLLPAESGSRHSSVSFLTRQRRDSVILSFCSTRTATWKMLRSWMHSGSWSGLIPGSGLFLPSRASPRITGDGRERLDTSARKCSPRT